jgi:uncharacterized protein
VIVGEPFNSIDLEGLSLSAGEGRHLDAAVAPEGLELAGEGYELEPRPAPAKLDVSRSAAGFAMRLRFEGEAVGPCMRCLAEARVPVAVEAREVDHPRATDEELRSPYVEEGVLDVKAWAHDALALALPPKLLCRADCAGLCAVCGEPLNDADPEAHRHDSGGDPRWAKLRELKLD